MGWWVGELCGQCTARERGGGVAHAGVLATVSLLAGLSQPWLVESPHLCKMRSLGEIAVMLC